MRINPVEHLYPFGVALLLVLFSSGVQGQETLKGQQEQEPARQAQLTLDQLRTFTDVFNQLRRNYVEPVDDKTLLDAAIRGMLMDLDPHSSYTVSYTHLTLPTSAVACISRWSPYH